MGTTSVDSLGGVVSPLFEEPVDELLLVSFDMIFGGFGPLNSERPTLLRCTCRLPERLPNKKELMQ